MSDLADTGGARLGAIVPVHDGGDDIGLCLDALIAAGLSPSDVLVVDDGSRDGAAVAAALSRGVRHEMLVDGPGGPARARNIGAALSPGADVLLFVDADVVVHPDAVTRFGAVLAERPDVSAAFGSYDDSPPASGWISQYKNLLHHHVHQRSGGEACTFWSGCGAVRRDAFVLAGGFDEGFDRASIEDVDLGLRLTDSGHRILLCPDIQCTHRKAWTLGGWLRTDIFLRALPWSRLLVRRGRGVPSTLNLDRRERWSAALAGGVVLSPLGLTISASVAAFAFLASLAGFVGLQRELIGFFVRHRGWLFAAAATSMHVLYFVYSGAVFAFVRITAPFGDGPFVQRV